MVQQILCMGNKKKHKEKFRIIFRYFRFPFVAISIALAINKQVEIGVIYNPVLDLLYSAIRGKGAFKNGRPIKCSGQTGDWKENTNEKIKLFLSRTGVISSSWRIWFKSRTGYNYG